MKLTTLAGAAAAAALTVALGAPMANAADARTTGSSTPAFASDCYRTHFWDGRMHPYSRIFCDYDDGFDRDYYVQHPEFRYHGSRDHSEHSGRDDLNRGEGTRGDVNRNASPAERGATDSAGTDRGTVNHNASPAERGATDNAGTADRAGGGDRTSAGSGGAADRGGAAGGGAAGGGAGNMPGGR